MLANETIETVLSIRLRWFENKNSDKSFDDLTISALLYFRLLQDSPGELSHDNELEGNCILRERHLQNAQNVQQQIYDREPTCIYQNEYITKGSHLQLIPNLQLQSNYGQEMIYTSDYLQNIPNYYQQPNSAPERISRSEGVTQRRCSEHTPTLQTNYGGPLECIRGKEDIVRGNHLHSIPNQFLQPQPTYGQEDCIPGSHLQGIQNLQQRPTYGLGSFSNPGDLTPTSYLQNMQGELQGNYELDRIYGRTAPPTFPLSHYTLRESASGNIHIFTGATNMF